MTDTTPETMTEEQKKNAIALYMTLLESISPEFYELKKLIDVFLPLIQFGEIHAKFIIQNGRITRVESYPLISRMVKENKL